jgi:hypothetical protein
MPYNCYCLMVSRLELQGGKLSIGSNVAIKDSLIIRLQHVFERGTIEVVIERTNWQHA